jgi:drug/metabolite transporter (DMT)-like permease
LGAWPVLKEAPHLYHAVGFGFILCGVALSGMRRG